MSDREYITATALDTQQFWPYGYYADLLNPSGIRIGEAPIQFYRDMLQLSSADKGNISFSVCKVDPRPPLIQINEFHSYTGEGILPLDHDVVIHVAAASPEPPGLEDFRAFRVPKGTMVVLRPGVWHHAPFATGEQAAHVLVVLPERTYANDCQSVTLEQRKWVGISL